MNSSLTDINIVLDRSGSMNKISSDVKGGFDQFIGEQREQPGNANVTLAQFDDKYEVVYSGKDIRDVPALVHTPRGMTALYDAIGRTINTAGERLARIPERSRPGNVIFVIITDGFENRSREFSQAQIKSMIEHQRSKYAWEFVFIGANQDAALSGGKIGIHTTQDWEQTKIGTKALWANASVSMSNYRGGKGYSTVDHTKPEIEEVTV